MNHRISILANSQGTRAGVGLRESYPALVSAALAEQVVVQPMAMSGWSVSDFNTHLDSVLLFEPDLVVGQFGIVECARRILSERTKRFLAAAPGGSRITRRIHARRKSVIRFRHRLGLDVRMYTPDRFRDELERMATTLSAHDIKLLLLEVPPFSADYERRHYPLINDDIGLFNTVLTDLGAVPLLQASDVARPIWQEGTVHLNPEGHQVAAQRLLAILASERAMHVAPGGLPDGNLGSL